MFIIIIYHAHLPSSQYIYSELFPFIDNYSSENMNKIVEFINEALIMETFNHPNVLRLVGISISHNKPQIVFPFMENGPVKDYLKKHKEVRLYRKTY